jgi:lipopolysaccharide transport system permease protein
MVHMAQIAITSSPEDEVTILRPSKGWSALNLADIWRYRELVYFLIWRDVKVRYKQTALGAGWAVIQPFMTMVVFTIFFGRIAQISTGDIPYPLFSYAGLLPWGLFTKALSDSGRSMVSHRSMITKVYFPRLVIPLASVIGGIVDFAIAFVVLLAMLLYFNSDLGGASRVVPGLAVLTLPLFLLMALITALGVGLWLSALNVIYRDINYITPFLINFWLFLTPVGYPSSMISEKWQLIYSLNPMTGVVEGFRWAILGSEAAPGLPFLVSAIISLILLISGLFFFRRMERTFADMV